MKCKGCGKHPCEISEYTTAAGEERTFVEEYVRRKDGTYNEVSDLFWCAECYFKEETPLGTA